MGKANLSLLAVYLKEKRLSAGLSQGDVSKKLGYTSPQFVSNWERGLSEPPIVTTKKLAAIYDIPIDEMYDVILNSTIRRLTNELRRKFDGKKK